MERRQFLASLDHLHEILDWGAGGKQLQLKFNSFQLYTNPSS
jgi:hypothetical protein